jgi:Sulfotransferase family
MNRKIAFILGTGHCGSTLLDLILSSHSRAFGLGELRSLARSDRFFRGEAPVSNISGFDDTFWTPEVVRAIEPFFRRQALPRRVLSRLLPRTDRRRAELYRYLFERSGASLLVDSSKGAGWFRHFLQQRTDDMRGYAILLRRDPRAVVNSYLRKFPERGVETVARHHKQQVDALTAFMAAHVGPKLELSYETLASEPDAVARQACAFLGLEYEPSMLDFWRFDHHHIAGNAGTKSLIIKFRSQEQEALIDSRYTGLHRHGTVKEYYQQHTLAIQLDERWKTELSPEAVRTIETVMAGG